MCHVQSKQLQSVGSSHNACMISWTLQLATHQTSTPQFIYHVRWAQQLTSKEMRNYLWRNDGLERLLNHSCAWCCLFYQWLCIRVAFASSLPVCKPTADKWEQISYIDETYCQHQSWTLPTDEPVPPSQLQKHFFCLIFAPCTYQDVCALDPEHKACHCL
jgi:hypothetical protein